jgi:focal adhesion kinase 1
MQNFDHPHIIKLIGILIPETFGIVMEFAKFGQLQSYLQSHKDQIEMETLLLYCLQLNSAMVYLECKNYVHRLILGICFKQW